MLCTKNSIKFSYVNSIQVITLTTTMVNSKNPNKSIKKIWYLFLVFGIVFNMLICLQSQFSSWKMSVFKRKIPNLL